MDMDGVVDRDVGRFFTSSRRGDDPSRDMGRGYIPVEASDLDRGLDGGSEGNDDS